MIDKEKVIMGLECCIPRNGTCQYKQEPICPYVEHCQKEDYAALQRDALVLLKEQEEWLRKFQKDKDKLCLEVSKWKHKFHDAPPKFVSQGVVDQIRWERDTALSQLEQIGKGLGSKMDDIVALLKEQGKPNGKCVNECECWDSAYERGKQDALKEQEEVKPKQGEWIYCEDASGQDGYKCSECGFFEPWYYDFENHNFITDYAYCPSCGKLLQESR